MVAELCNPPSAVLQRAAADGADSLQTGYAAGLYCLSVRDSRFGPCAGSTAGPWNGDGSVAFHGGGVFIGGGDGWDVPVRQPQDKA